MLLYTYIMFVNSFSEIVDVVRILLNTNKKIFYRQDEYTPKDQSDILCAKFRKLNVY